MDTEKEIEEIKKRLDKIEETINEFGSSHTTPKQVNIRKQISIKEFLLSKKPSSDVTKALVIGYYLERYKGLNSFNTKDLEDGFRQAKEQFPININETVNKNISKGHMMETGQEKDSRKAWVLTSSGEQLVDAGF